MAAPKRRITTTGARPAVKRRASPAAGARRVAKRRSARRKPIPPWMLLTGGLAFGVAVSLLYSEAKNFDWDTLWGADLDAPAAPTATTATTEEEPRFDFYAILPNQEVVVPDPQPPKAKTATSSAAEKQPAVPPGVYYLQVGSFRKHTEARGMKAQVTLLGTPASIQTVTLDQDTWHRVWVGPYKNPNILREVRARLRDNKIETLLVRARR